MKNRIFILCIALVILSLNFFTACSDKTEIYTVYEINNGLTENSSLGVHNYQFSSTVDNSEDVFNSNQKVTIRVGDLELEGEYQSTETYELYGTSVKKYNGTDQYGRAVEFNIDDATGKLSCLSYMMFTETDHLHTQEECQEIAQDFLTAIVGDRADYVLYNTKTREIPEYGGALYEFSFAKTFGDLLSDEDIQIDVSAYGVIEYYMAYFLYEDDSTDELTYDEQTADEAIASQIAAMYGELETSDFTFASYKIKTKRISKFHDGNNYIRYEVHVQLDSKSVEYFEKHETLDLAVRIP